MIWRLLAPLWKWLAYAAGLAWLRADAKKDARTEIRLQMSEDRVATLQEARRNEAEAMAQDDAELTRRLTRK